MEVMLKHTVEEVNAILTALGQRPFAEVADLINKIKASAMAQLAPPAAPVEAVAETTEQ